MKMMINKPLGLSNIKSFMKITMEKHIANIKLFKSSPTRDYKGKNCTDSSGFNNRTESVSVVQAIFIDLMS